MKKTVLLSTLLTTSVVFASGDIFKGCGDDEKEARSNLANNIYTNVKSETLTQKSSGSVFGINSFMKNFKTSSKQTSNVSLSNVKITHENKQVCAVVDKDDLLKVVEGLIAKIDLYDEKLIDSINSTKNKARKIDKILLNIEEAKGLSGLFKDELPSDTAKKLEDKHILFTKLAEVYPAQFVKFTILGDKDVDLLIDNKQNHKPNENIYLKSGDYKFTIKSDKFCDVEEKFTIEKNKDLEKTIDLNKYQFPYMIINSNKEGAQLVIDGKNVGLGQRYEINTCDGKEIPYKISYNDQQEDGVFIASVNNSFEKSFNFLSRDELNKIKEKVDNYKDTSRIEVKYGYMAINLDENYEDFENVNFVQLGKISSYNALRYGYGVVYGQASNSRVYEAYYNLGLQLTSIGDTILRVGSIAVVPNINVQVGLGYHNLYNTKTQTFQHDNFVIKDTTVANSEDDDFFRDYGVLKGNLGIDFILNKDIVLNIYGQKQFTMEESVSFGAGFAFTF